MKPTLLSGDGYETKRLYTGINPPKGIVIEEIARETGYDIQNLIPFIGSVKIPKDELVRITGSVQWVHTEDPEEARVLRVQSPIVFPVVSYERNSLSDPNKFRKWLSRSIGANENLLSVHMGGESALQAVFRWIQAQGSLKVSIKGSEYFGALRLIQEMRGEISSLNPQLFYCSEPNNPTGKQTPSEELIEKLLGQEAECILVDMVNICADSVTAFEDVEKVFKALEESRKLVFIVSSLSKRFGVAGDRLGFVLCNQAKVARTLRNFEPPGLTPNLENCLSTCTPGKYRGVLARHTRNLSRWLRFGSSHFISKLSAEGMEHSNFLVVEFDSPDHRQNFLDFIEKSYQKKYRENQWEPLKKTDRNSLRVTTLSEDCITWAEEWLKCISV